MSQDKENKDKIPCQVCGHPNARLRYNSYVCNACRVFFSRHYNSNFAFNCDTNGNCVISYQKQRMNCISCRMKKCYEVNMTKNGGQTGIVDTLHKSHNSSRLMKKLTEMYGEIMNSGFKVAGYLQNSQSNSEWINCLLNFDCKLLSPGGKSPSESVAYTNMSLNDCLMYPGSCIDRTTAVVDSMATINPAVPYKLKESVARIIIGFVETMAFFEEYHQLSPLDRIRLVQQNIFMLSNYVLLFLKHIKGWNNQASVQYMTRFKMANGIASQWSKILSIWSNPSHSKTIGLMKELLPTEKEWLLLRMRAMFRPCPTMSTDGYALALKTRLIITYRLAEHIRETNPNLTQEQIHHRLLKLLEIEVCIQNFDQIMYTIYTAIILDHSSELATPLLYDIFIRKF